MYRISYRKGLFLKKLLRISLIVLAVLLVVGLCVLIYLEPFVVYDRQGAHLRLDAAPAAPETGGQTAPRPQVGVPNIIYEEQTTTDKTILEQGGYFITTSMLQNPDRVLETLRSMEDGCAVMMDVKSVFGYFYYSSSIAGAKKADVDVAAVDQIISYLKSHDFYLIAVVPAFSDPNFALENQSCGLPLSSGALWMDERGCYWLDPGDETVLSYLMQIARELSSLGFHEVAYTEFRFPDSQSISYPADRSREEVLAQAANEISAFFTGSNLSISFVTEGTDFPQKGCRSRLYITDADGSKVEKYVQSYGSRADVQELVFLANSRDPRFNDHAVLRPLLTE